MFLGIIFFLELTAGVLAFVFKDWIKDQLYFFINNNIRAYRDDIDLQNLIDFTQEYVSLNLVYWQVESLLRRMTPENILLASASASWNPPLTFLHGFWSVCWLFSDSLYDLHDLYPKWKYPVFTYLNFSWEEQRRKLLSKKFLIIVALFRSTFEEYCFAVGLAFYLVLNMDSLSFLVPFLIILHTSQLRIIYLLINRIFSTSF